MAILLSALWALGVASGAALGGWVHLMLAFAVIALTLAVAQSWGRTASKPNPKH